MTPFFRKGHPRAPSLKKQRPEGNPPAEPDVAASVIARGMTLVGECRSRDTIRIEGRVEGGVRSGKAIVIAEGGVVLGDISAHDAIISGRVRGGVTTASSVKLKASCVVDGEIDTLNIAVEKGALVNVAFRRSPANTWREPDWEASLKNACNRAPPDVVDRTASHDREDRGPATVAGVPERAR